MQTTIRTKPTKYRSLDAAACVRRYLRGTWLAVGIAIVLVLVTAGVFLTHTQELSLWLYLFLILLILAGYTVVIGLRAMELYHILYTDCDPVKFLEILQRLQKKTKRARARNTLHLQCALTLSYLNDWDGAYRELTQFRADRCRNRNLKLSHLNLLGDYCLAKDQKEDFEACRSQLLALTAEGNPREKKLADEILMVWDRRIACILQDREKERELLNQLLSQKRYLIQQVTWIFRLAQLDLLEGERINARERLKTVREYGNTLTLRAWAEEIWNAQGFACEQEENQKETGEINNGNDTE